MFKYIIRFLVKLEVLGGKYFIDYLFGIELDEVFVKVFGVKCSG